MNKQLITIEGNIGAGKTTLAQMLARDYNARLILEEFSDNPFLSRFYEDPARYGFPVELFFMAERYNQLKEQISEQDLFSTMTITDYLFIKSLLFASINLSDQEYSLYQRLFNIINPTLPRPDILLYLHVPTDLLLQNIHNRGRYYEYQIDEGYLQNIQDRYFSYFKSVRDQLRIVVMDASAIDFVENPADYQKIKNALEDSYSPGIHYVNT